MPGCSVQEAAKYFKVHPATIRAWIRRGCCAIELGQVGRGHGSRLDLMAVEQWLRLWRTPTLAAQVDTDVLNVMATALYDTLKRDDLAGHTGMTDVQAQHVVLLIYERAYRNVKQTPLQHEDLPEEMKRSCANVVNSIEFAHEPFHRR